MKPETEAAFRYNTTIYYCMLEFTLYKPMIIYIYFETFYKNDTIFVTAPHSN